MGMYGTESSKQKEASQFHSLVMKPYKDHVCPAALLYKGYVNEVGLLFCFFLSGCGGLVLCYITSNGS